MADTDLLIDPDICFWVLFPLCIATISFGVIRHYLTQSSEKSLSAEEIEQKETVKRVNHLLTAKNMPKDEYMEEYNKLADPKTGLLRKTFKSDQLTKLLDPIAMNESVKRNIFSFLPNMAMMNFVSNFYGGIIVAKLPFEFPACLRPLLQKGIGLDTLPMHYVSATSMFFILLLIQRPIVSFIVGESSKGGDMGPDVSNLMSFASNPNKMYQNSLQQLELHMHTYCSEKAS